MEESFQNIYDIIEPSLPESWEKIVLFSAFKEQVCEIIYYVNKQQSYDYQDCFSLGLSKEEIFSIVDLLNKEIATARDRNVEGEKWNTIIMSIKRDGTFIVNYDYDELSIENGLISNTTLRKYLDE